MTRSGTGPRLRSRFVVHTGAEGFRRVVTLPMLSPANYPIDKVNLAILLAEKQSLPEAEKLLRQAMKAAPENIALIESLRSVLRRQQKWGEDQVLADRIHKLESLDKRR